jgi:hypothetical protein
MNKRWPADVRRAHAVAVRDRGEALHRGAEQPPERLRLRLAELRVLGGHVRHRAVMLAELLSACRGRRAAG